MDAKHPSFMTTGTSYAIRVLLTLLLIVCAAMLSSSGQFYREALVDAFFAFALASVVIIHLRISPSWTDAVLLPAIAFVPAIVDFRLLHYQPRLMAGLSFLGLSSFLIMATRTVWAKEATTAKKLLYAWAPAALFVLSEYSASTMLQWTTAAHPKTLDLYLLSFDYSLHVPIVFITGQLYSLRPWLHNASLLAYVGLAVPIALVYAGRLVRFKEKASSAMLAFLITGPLGILFYNLFPACGPHALFQQGFPFHPFPMAQASRLQLEAMVVPGPRKVRQ